MLFVVSSAALAAAFGFASWHLLQRGAVDPRVWSVAAAVLLWSVGIGVKSTWGPAQPSPSVTSTVNSLPVESIVWPGTVAAPPLPSSGGSLTDAAPIASLIGKLEARLAAEPGDASGWTLLAQSYAFTGNEEAAEHALKRAVELGIDEVQLRNRVKLARRKNSAGNWIDRAIGG